jgi:hypothetical protein
MDSSVDLPTNDLFEYTRISIVVSGQWLVVSSHAEIRTDYKFESLITIIDPISDRPFRAILYQLHFKIRFLVIYQWNIFFINHIEHREIREIREIRFCNFRF